MTQLDVPTSDLAAASAGADLLVPDHDLPQASTPRAQPAAGEVPLDDLHPAHLQGLSVPDEDLPGAAPTAGREPAASPQAPPQPDALARTQAASGTDLFAAMQKAGVAVPPAPPSDFQTRAGGRWTRAFDAAKNRWQFGSPTGETLYADPNGNPIDLPVPERIQQAEAEYAGHRQALAGRDYGGEFGYDADVPIPPLHPAIIEQYSNNPSNPDAQQAYLRNLNAVNAAYRTSRLKSDVETHQYQTPEGQALLQQEAGQMAQDQGPLGAAVTALKTAFQRGIPQVINPDLPEEEALAGADAQQRPISSAVGGMAGNLLNPETLGIAAATEGVGEIAAPLGRVGQAAVKGAVFQGGAGTAQRLNEGQPVTAGTIARDVGTGAVLGPAAEGAGSVVGRGVQNLPAPVQVAARTAGGAAVAGGLNVAANAAGNPNYSAKQAVADFVAGSAVAIPTELPHAIEEMVAARNRIAAVDPDNSHIQRLDAEIARHAIQEKSSTPAAAAAPPPAGAEVPAHDLPETPPSDFGGYPEEQPLSRDELEHNARVDRMKRDLTSQSAELGRRAQDVRDTQAFDTLMQQHKAERIGSYTPENVNRMDAGQLRQAAQDLGIPYDAPSTTIPRILDEVKLRQLETLSDKDLFNEARRVISDNRLAGVKAGSREQNLSILRGWHESRRVDTPERPASPPSTPEAAPSPETQAPPAASREADTTPTAQGAAVYRGKNAPDHLPPVPEGMERFFHGGVPGEGARWVTPDYRYAEGYASKSGDAGKVQYVDIPADHPILEGKKAFDDSGTNMKSPYVSFEAPAEIMKGAKLAETPQNIPNNIPAESPVNTGEKEAGGLNSTPSSETSPPRPKPKPPRSRPASDLLLDQAKADGLTPSDTELTSDEGNALHPDQAEQMSASERAKAAGRFDENKFANATAGMSAEQIARFEQVQRDRLASTRAEQLADAIEHYKEHPDPNLRMLALQAEAEGTGPKQSVNGSMFGDMSPGAASELEAQVQREAAQQKKAGEHTGNMFAPNPEDVKGFGGRATRNSDIGRALFGEKSTLQQDVVPKASDAAKAIGEAAADIRRTLAPQTAGADARSMKGIAREHGATLAQRTDRAEAALHTARRYFEGQKPQANYDFIHRMETGQRQPTPQMETIARTLRELMDGRRREVQALGKNQLDNFIENYFPHIWKDPQRAESIFSQAAGRRPLEGSRSFLKARSIPTIKDGLEKGLEPVSDNPVDLALLKIREMDKYILGQRMLQEMKGRGLAKFVRATDKAPEGYKRIDDRIAQVYGPPTVKVDEYVDKATHDALTQTLDNLGVDHQRVANTRSEARKLGLSMPAGTLGYSVQGHNQVVSQFATDLGVVAHELGHQIDHRWDLIKNVATPYKDEMDALTRLRYTGHDEEAVPKSVKEYNLDPDEQAAQIVEAYVHAPDRMRQVAPNVYDRFTKFIDQHPELAPLKTQSSLSYERLTNEVPHGGLLKMGEYWAPEQAADVINNYLSPGLRGKSALFRGVLGAGNLLNQAQLGLSGFHLAFTSQDAMASKLAIAFQHLSDGNLGQFVRHGLETPVAPFTTMVRGNKVLREWYQPGSQGEEIARIVDAMKAGGGRARMDAFYRTNVTNNMMKAFRSGNVLGGLFRAPFAAVETAAKPIMEYVVPRQKMGVFADMARRELASLPPDAPRSQVREAMARAWDSVDNRMGQLVYDNLFWNKTVKDLSMASVRSLGWNLGTIRELGGAAAVDLPKALYSLARGQKPELTSRMAYAAAMPITAGMLGALTYYAYNGKAPETLMDYFFPRTGEKDEEGHDKRVALASYMKDVFDYAHAPGRTLVNKLHPEIGMIAEMLQNKDFYGEKIRNEDDPLIQQLLDEAKFVGKQYIPFGIRNALAGDRASSRVLPFAGVTPAPKWIETTKAEQLAQQLKQAQIPAGARTSAQVEKSQLKEQLRAGLRAGKPDADQRIQDAVAGGQLTDSEAKQLHTEAGLSYLQHLVKGLDAAGAVKVLSAATPAERPQIEDQVRDTILRSRSLTPEEQDQMLAKAGIQPPPDLSIDREYSALDEKAQADQKRIETMKSVARQIVAAEQQQDYAKGAELRRQLADMRGQGNQLAGPDRARLAQLRAGRAQIKAIEQRIAEGSMSREAGAARLARIRAALQR